MLFYQLQNYDFLHLTYPTVLGTDVAGEIVEVGSGVVRVKSGQRVIGYDQLKLYSLERKIR